MTVQSDTFHIHIFEFHYHIDKPQIIKKNSPKPIKELHHPLKACKCLFHFILALFFSPWFPYGFYFVSFVVYNWVYFPFIVRMHSRIFWLQHGNEINFELNRIETTIQQFACLKKKHLQVTTLAWEHYILSVNLQFDWLKLTSS